MKNKQSYRESIEKDLSKRKNWTDYWFIRIVFLLNILTITLLSSDVWIIFAKFNLSFIRKKGFSYFIDLLILKVCKSFWERKKNIKLLKMCMKEWQIEKALIKTFKKKIWSRLLIYLHCNMLNYVIRFMNMKCVNVSFLTGFNYIWSKKQNLFQPQPKELNEWKR